MPSHHQQYSQPTAPRSHGNWSRVYQVLQSINHVIKVCPLGATNQPFIPLLHDSQILELQSLDKRDVTPWKGRRDLTGRYLTCVRSGCSRRKSQKKKESRSNPLNALYDFSPTAIIFLCPVKLSYIETVQHSKFSFVATPPPLLIATPAWRSLGSFAKGAQPLTMSCWLHPQQQRTTAQPQQLLLQHMRCTPTPPRSLMYTLAHSCSQYLPLS